MYEAAGDIYQVALHAEEGMVQLNGMRALCNMAYDQASHECFFSKQAARLKFRVQGLGFRFRVVQG